MGYELEWADVLVRLKSCLVFCLIGDVLAWDGQISILSAFVNIVGKF